MLWKKKKKTCKTCSIPFQRSKIVWKIAETENVHSNTELVLDSHTLFLPQEGISLEMFWGKKGTEVNMSQLELGLIDLDLGCHRVFFHFCIKLTDSLDSYCES